MADISLLEETEKSLERIQKFDPKTLVQTDKLGAHSFGGAVLPAKRLVDHFKLLPTGTLDQFANSEVSIIKSTCDSVHSIFQEILSFDPDVGDNKNRQQALIDRLDSLFQSIFSQSYMLIAFSTARTVDFNKLDEQGRAAVQSIKDQSDRILDELQEKQKTVDRILQDAREVAAEQGVTLQASFFADESVRHLESSKKWLVSSVCMAVAVVLYAGATLFFSKIPIFAATDTSNAIQITTSKLLVFFVLLYALIQCVKNYSAHMHNGIVNKHRQNSLLTYRTLSEASATLEGRETVLQHAAAAIYAPNDSGYVRNEERGYSDGGLVGMVGRALTNTSSSSQ